MNLFFFQGSVFGFRGNTINFLSSAELRIDCPDELLRDKIFRSRPHHYFLFNLHNMISS